jgi:hypothetical protein
VPLLPNATPYRVPVEVGCNGVIGDELDRASATEDDFGVDVALDPLLADFVGLSGTVRGISPMRTVLVAVPANMRAGGGVDSAGVSSAASLWCEVVLTG